MTTEQIGKGDQVSWQWAGSRPSGEVAEVAKEGDVSIQTKNDNTIIRHGEPADPAVHITREGNDVVKKAHELTIEKKASAGTAPLNGEAAQKKEEPSTAAKENGEPKVGEKRENGAINGNENVEKSTQNGEKSKEIEKEETAKDDEDEPPAKKPKTQDDDNDEDQSAKKGRGRPKKGDGSATSPNGKPAKKRERKPAATADGQPRRSARFRS